MFKRILVPLDGSARAERALPVAARIARASGGTVVLLQAASHSLEWGPPYPGLQLTESEDEQATRYLAGIAQSNGLAGITTETIACSGMAAPNILKATRAHNIDLIVLCSHGYTGFTRWRLGSVAEKVARHAPVPVLVLHADGPVPAGSPKSPGHPLRVLVALDGSPLAEASLRPAAHLAAMLAAPASGAIHLARVVQLLSPKLISPVPSDSSMRDPMLSEATEYLSGIVDRLRTGDLAALQLTITWSIAFETDVAGAIAQMAEHNEDAHGVGVVDGCDLIAMATHGRSGPSRWMLGSVTERVLHATKLPLLIVRSPGMAVTPAEVEEQFIEIGTSISADSP